MTARDIIEAALRKNGYSGETPSPTEMADGLEALKAEIGAISSKGLMVESVTWDSFSMVSSQAAYTIGASGSPDVSDTRPESIEGAFVRVGSSDYPVEMIGEAAYRSILQKSTGGRPFQAWYNATVPNGTLTLYYTPNSTDTFYYAHRQPITEPSGLSSTMTIARSYDQPLIWILAESLAPEYNKEPTPYIQRMAIKARGDIAAANVNRRIEEVWTGVVIPMGSTRTIEEG